MPTRTKQPNRKPFPRGNQRARCLSHGLQPDIHVLVRTGHLRYFQSVNPDGYWHDLGAQDVFLDDLGVLFFEQFDTALPATPYVTAHQLLLARWQRLEQLVVRSKPFWGDYLNAWTRQANSGEPRSLLRLDRYANQLDTAMRLEEEEAEPVYHRPFDWYDLVQRMDTRELFWSRRSDIPWLWDVLEGSRYRDWDPSPLLPEPLQFRDTLLPPSREFEEKGTGVSIEALERTVPAYRILPIEYATPDLPPRVGVRAAELAKFSSHVRDQGQHPTCVAFAVCTALDILRSRVERGRARGLFCPANLHLSSGDSWCSARTLSQVIGALRQELPVLQPAVYPTGAPDEEQLFSDLTTLHLLDNGRTSARYGPPLIRNLAVRNIPELKAHLAAGWVVVISTFLTEETHRSNALNLYGYPLRPLPGQKRTTGHAWTVVGYEHVDGNQQWKYQGRFVALNSWGRDHPIDPVLGHGLVSLPFSFVFSEGIEAYALRLPSLEKDSFSSGDPSWTG